MTDIPGTTAKIQAEAARFRSAVTAALLGQEGGCVNGLLDAILPIGTIVPTLLTEAQFQGLTSTNWVLFDSRTIVGTALNDLIGIGSLPDGRGVFLRGKNNGRNDGKEDPAGELAIGTYEADQIKSHQHTIDVSKVTETVSDGTIAKDEGSEYKITAQTLTEATGAAETRPRCIIVNFMIRVN